MPSYLGLDVGGANLKAAHTSGVASLLPFELWKKPDGLVEALRGLFAIMPPFDALAVTMTGELCDCFATKREGVQFILDAVASAAANRPIHVWRTDGRFVSVAEARATPLQTAAANWLALATYAGRFAPQGPAVLIDIGSTTTDIVPLVDGKPAPRGRPDPDRLRCGELVYTGVRRTPLCALLGGGAAAELFATTLDVCLILEALPEDPSDRATADGRPATRAAAHARLARMLCADAETCTPAETRKLAERALLKQVHLLTSALRQVSERLPGLQTVILAGSGEFLARTALAEQEHFPLSKIVSLTEQLGPEISQAACAYALAVLASEQSP
ncbi:MAG TPA: hydantoinase/oxoprolinase family protein [Gemmataceae bacterium]|nr:hydantoinase/oxoprolinase family protein [Gemmataceae bacterium]